jgi:hypothetical protein
VRHLGKVHRKTKTRGLFVDCTAHTFNMEGSCEDFVELLWDGVVVWRTCGKVTALDVGFG